ncbi:MAG: PhzF family phenazine biosynthesis protein [Parvibaculaceae bacterium]
MPGNRFFWIDAFAPEPFTGNPAVVCLLDDDVAASAMQAMAREFNVSETVFLRGADGEYDIRWFTPTRELPLVGHATLAAAHAIMTAVEPKRRSVVFNSHLSGRLPATREGDGFAITLPADEIVPCELPIALRDGLGTVAAETHIGRHYVAVLRSAGEVASVKPDFAALATLDRPTIAITAPGEDADYVLRFFAPANGVPEDPVSGVAQCSLVPYWAKRLGRDTLHSRQLSERRGRMTCTLQGVGVIVAGPCRTIAEGTMPAISA